MDEYTRKGRELDALENIAKELERLRVLKEHELGVELKEAPRGAALTCLKSRSRGCYEL
jgi:hypothetical protein